MGSDQVTPPQAVSPPPAPMDSAVLQRLKDISERYIQQLHAVANANMGIARSAYFELIKILLTLGVTQLPSGHTVDEPDTHESPHAQSPASPRTN